MDSLTNDPVVALIMHPGLWLTLLVIWILWAIYSRRHPHISPRYDKKRNAPGDLVADGSSATSKTELRVRKTIAAAGYHMLAQGTGLVVASRDAHGHRRKFTPDIMIYRPKKLIVEVDPHFWHGREGDHKIFEDIERNKQYNALGYPVVRVRLGWAGHQYQQLGPFDVITPESDYYPAKNARDIIKAIRKAEVRPARYWDSILDRLRPVHEQHKQDRSAARQQPDPYQQPTQMPGQYPGYPPQMPGQYPGYPPNYPGPMPGQAF